MRSSARWLSLAKLAALGVSLGLPLAGCGDGIGRPIVLEQPGISGQPGGLG